MIEVIKTLATTILILLGLFAGATEVRAQPPAGSRPFVCMGQTAIPYPARLIENPTPNAPSGLIGACTSLPYKVPKRYTLVINSAQLEGLWGSGLVIFVGPTNRTTNAFPTLAARSIPIPDEAKIAWAGVQASVQFTDLNWQIAAGSQVGVELSANVNQTNIVIGWGLSGWLVPTQ